MKTSFFRAAILAAAAAILALGLAGCGQSAASDSAQSNTGLPASSLAQSGAESLPAEPEAGEEYRAMWVSYLEWQGFDFSSEDAFCRDVQTLMQNCKALGCNTVIAQVRPFADALYPTELFPWSHVMTGAQGDDPGFDPLAVLVREAHAQGLQLEAWVNPYRVALNASTPGAMANDSLLYTHNDWIKASGEGYYLNPALAEVRDFICEGVAEIVQNYEVDGIHYDDYFYPTTDPSFDSEDYAAANTTLSLEDWRRENVNALVSETYKTIKSIRPACRFGISPQGNNSNNYNGQFSDVGLWLKTPGYVDYVMPQVYWGYGYTTKGGSTDYAFENVTASWAAMERDASVSLYFGLGAYRIGDGDGGNYEHNTDQWNTGHELADMVETLRQAGGQGYALYRYDFLYKNAAYPELAQAECAALRQANG